MSKSDIYPIISIDNCYMTKMMITFIMIIKLLYDLIWLVEGEGEEAAEESDEAAPAPSILRDCNLVITRGMRIVVRGPNGAGGLGRIGLGLVGYSNINLLFTLDEVCTILLYHGAEY